MISVAQRTAVPLIPAPRGRFTAMTVGSGSQNLAGMSPKLRSLGASAVHSTATARSGPIPRPSTSHDVCVVETDQVQLAEELRALRTVGWRRVVVVAGHTDEVRVAMTSGARSAIVPATRSAAVALIPARPTRAHSDLGDTLSDREIQVLQGVAAGHSNKQIGQELCLSALTVKSHLARIARKLGTGDRAEMVAIGIRQGFVA